jgi:hypothetical protein
LNVNHSKAAGPYKLKHRWCKTNIIIEGASGYDV